MTKYIREMVSASGIENVSRRGLLKGILSTTGLVLVVHALPPGPALAADAPKWGADGMPHGTVNNPLAFVSIAPDGTVTIVCRAARKSGCAMVSIPDDARTGLVNPPVRLPGKSSREN
jgi:isoquinoline 1-oxidoreductase beta subunit